MVIEEALPKVMASALISSGQQAVGGDQKVVVVGDGRVGRAFVQMAGHRAKLISRGQLVVYKHVEEEEKFPIIVATHCSHLEEVLKQTCVNRWKDLVFLQNGMLQPWLYQHGLENNTQALLFMSATPQDPLQPKGYMSIKDGGRESLVWGRWASVMTQIMQIRGLQCSTVTHGKFMEGMVEKLLWSSIFWLLSAAFGGLPVGLIAERHNSDIENLVSELLPLAKSYLRSDRTHEEGYRSVHVPSAGQTVIADGGQMIIDYNGEPSLGTNAEMVQGLCGYSMAIPDAVPSVNMAVSEFDWRNGWFLSQKITPCHVMWLKRAGFNPEI